MPSHAVACRRMPSHACNRGDLRKARRSARSLTLLPSLYPPCTRTPSVPRQRQRLASRWIHQHQTTSPTWSCAGCLPSVASSATTACADAGIRLPCIRLKGRRSDVWPKKNATPLLFTIYSCMHPGPLYTKNSPHACIKNASSRVVIQRSRAPAGGYRHVSCHMCACVRAAVPQLQYMVSGCAGFNSRSVVHSVTVGT